MPRIISVKQYAQATFELALEKDTLENWRDELHKIECLIADMKVMSLLENPKLPFERKTNFLKKCIGKTDPLILNLVFLLMSRGKLKILGDISEQYKHLIDVHYGIQHVHVITAIPLDNKNKKKLSDGFAKIIGHNIIIDARIDPSIVGGFTAKIGDTLIDGSLHTMLESLKKRLLLAGC
jgi:F-type H+-transporting ATPase subunit delta